MRHVLLLIVLTWPHFHGQIIMPKFGQAAIQCSQGVGYGCGPYGSGGYGR
jgi:hypothetical protein